jgi:hypothetical protein
MATDSSTQPPISADRLADLLERHADSVVPLLVAALRAAPSDVAVPPAARTTPTGGPARHWNKVGVIEAFDHVWPNVHEHYPPMDVWETVDERGVARLAIGRPAETLELYGRVRGWVSVWEVVNGQPREQRAVFVDCDDYATTGEGIALISGKDGRKRGLYAPGEEHLLPPTYRALRVEVHRDRCNGPYAKNRLGVIASDEDVEVMLNHGLAHLRLRA